MALSFLVLGRHIAFAETIVPADFVFKGGPHAVYTSDPARPYAEAVAVSGKKIVFVGTAAAAKPHEGPKTQIVDLEGKTLMPGIIDAHNHALMALSRPGFDLRKDCSSKEAILEQVRQYDKEHPGTDPIMAWGWPFKLFPKESDLPTAKEIDAVVSNRPVLLLNEDSHNLWLNTMALERAGITKDTPDPGGGSRFTRDKAGNPAGMAIEVAATWTVLNTIHPLTDDVLNGAMDIYLNQARANGVTAYHEMGMLTPVESDAKKGYAYMRSLEDKGTLPVRVVGVVHKEGAYDPSDEGPEVYLQRLKDWNRAYQSELVQVNGMKIWVDGGFVSHTAMMLDGYRDRPSLRPESGWTVDVLTAWIKPFQEAGFDFHFHMEGDESTKRVLDAIERVHQTAKATATPPRHCLHHAFFIEASDIPRFKALGVGLGTQPLWTTNWTGGYYDLLQTMFGPETNARFFVHHLVMRSGANLTFSGDGIDEELNPFNQIYSAVTRKSPLLKNDSRFPEKKEDAFTIDEALKAYTINGAYQMRLEKKVGSIEVGKLADLCVFDRTYDGLIANPESVLGTKVELTMMNGKVTYTKP